MFISRNTLNAVAQYPVDNFHWPCCGSGALFEFGTIDRHRRIIVLVSTPYSNRRHSDKIGRDRRPSFGETRFSSGARVDRTALQQCCSVRPPRGFGNSRNRPWRNPRYFLDRPSMTGPPQRSDVSRSARVRFAKNDRDVGMRRFVLHAYRSAWPTRARFVTKSNVHNGFEYTTSRTCTLWKATRYDALQIGTIQHICQQNRIGRVLCLKICTKW